MPDKPISAASSDHSPSVQKLEAMRNMLSATEALRDMLTLQDMAQVSMLLEVRERLIGRIDNLDKLQQKRDELSPRASRSGSERQRLSENMREVMEKMIPINEDCASIAAHCCTEFKEAAAETSHQREGIHGYMAYPQREKRFLDCET